jgi:hypothetical protein
MTLYRPQGTHPGYSDWPAIEAYYKANEAELERCDREAVGAGTLVGRYITHPIADGQAVYQIIRENKRTVRIQVCRGLGDDWTLPAWGEEATISRSTAEEFLRRKDGMRRLFRGKV